MSNTHGLESVCLCAFPKSHPEKRLILNGFLHGGIDKGRKGRQYFPSHGWPIRFLDYAVHLFSGVATRSEDNQNVEGRAASYYKSIASSKLLML
jgi:hypothetical protein